eukprot:TRINITY_DN25728_c0_g1_i2.p1 TRINITY_DN25728_c0_g1~~TRINITY_DN25728_c0_g1_i2.p1  ORF type:complete len:132 (-),score=34.05 TRINITY_DN25728_c0_g1_i2:11-406(-)
MCIRDSSSSSSPSSSDHGGSNIRALAASAQLLAKIEVASFSLLEALSKDSILFNSMIAPLWSVPPLPQQQTTNTTTPTTVPSGTDHTNVFVPVSYTHLRAHETPEHLVCRLLLEKKKNKQNKPSFKYKNIL